MSKKKINYETMSEMEKEMRELNPHMYWDRRKIKKYNRKRAFALQRTGYFIDCNNKPCKLTKIWYDRTYYGDVEGECLIGGGQSSCSIFSCAPEPITKKEALERVAFYKAHDYLAYIKKYDYPNMTPEQETAYIKFLDDWNWFGHKPPEGHVIPVKADENADADASEAEKD